MPSKIEPLSVRLRRLRKKADLTQAALAEKAGLELDTLRAIEQGRRERVYADTLAGLAKALGVRMEDLLG